MTTQDENVPPNAEAVLPTELHPSPKALANQLFASFSENQCSLLTTKVDPSDRIVRDCCSQFYMRVLEELVTRDVITILSSPGMWMSTVCDYAVRRYREDHPESEVVWACFEDDRLVRCIVFSPGSPVGEVRATVPRLDGECIYFISGIPDRIVPRRKTVVFSTPDLTWLKEMFMRRDHERIYLPVWRLEELLRVNKDRCDQLAADTVCSRYQFFGGSAGICLSKDGDLVKEAEKLVLDTIAAVDSAEALASLLLAHLYTTWPGIPLLYYFPRTSGGGCANDYELRFASDRIAELVYERILGVDKHWWDVNRGDATENAASFVRCVAQFCDEHSF